jgi:hypothetical protein
MAPIPALPRETSITRPLQFTNTSNTSQTPSPTLPNPLQPPPSNQSPSDTIQTITFGILGIFFAMASIYVAYLQLRHMHRTPTMMSTSDTDVPMQDRMIYLMPQRLDKHDLTRSTRADPNVSGRTSAGKWVGRNGRSAAL